MNPEIKRLLWELREELENFHDQTQHVFAVRLEQLGLTDTLAEIYNKLTQAGRDIQTHALNGDMQGVADRCCRLETICTSLRIAIRPADPRTGRALSATAQRVWRLHRQIERESRKISEWSEAA